MTACNLHFRLALKFSVHVEKFLDFFCCFFFNSFADYVCNGSEVRDITLYVNDDGSVQKTQKLPDCSPGKINIIESSYCRREWYDYYGCPTNSKESFSQAAEYQLHQMCSWRERCLDGLKFPFKSFAQNKRTNAVNIKYTCSGNYGRESFNCYFKCFKRFMYN